MIMRMILPAGALLAAVALWAPQPYASDAHFVVVNDGDLSGDNFATVMKLSGIASNPLLKDVATLDTEVESSGVAFLPSVQIARVGPAICVFVADSTPTVPGQISAFQYPETTLVGNYSDANLPYDQTEAIVVAGGELYSASEGYVTSWAIGPGCTLSLQQTYMVATGDNICGMGVTPNGETLVLSEGIGAQCCVESLSIGANGTLTERSDTFVYAEFPNALDITADSRYAIFSGVPYCEPNCNALVMVIAINPDGSLGEEIDFGNGSLGSDLGFADIRLSPDGRFLYATGGDGTGEQVVTLNFSENPVNLSYGCSTTLRPTSHRFAAAGLATLGTTGAGNGLYVAESSDVSGVGLLFVDETTGCPREAPASPFRFSDPNAAPESLAAWPLRPF